jgi:O-antigen/teichoic acid export membrane protein
VAPGGDIAPAPRMKLLKHATAAFTANLVTAGAQYALVVLIARGLGPDAFGGFVFALAFGSLVAVLPNFGLDRILVRHVVRDRAAARSSRWPSRWRSCPVWWRPGSRRRRRS